MNPDIDTRALRRAIVGENTDPPVTAQMEDDLLRRGDPITLHMAAVSSRVSPEFLQELWDSAQAILEEVASNAHCPLEIVAGSRVRDLDDLDIAGFAHRMGRPDLVVELLDVHEDSDQTVGERWAELGGDPLPSADDAVA